MKPLILACLLAHLSSLGSAEPLDDSKGVAAANTALAKLGFQVDAARCPLNTPCIIDTVALKQEDFGERPYQKNLVVLRRDRELLILQGIVSRVNDGNDEPRDYVSARTGFTFLPDGRFAKAELVTTSPGGLSFFVTTCEPAASDPCTTSIMRPASAAPIPIEMSPARHLIKEFQALTGRSLAGILVQRHY